METSRAVSFPRLDRIDFRIAVELAQEVVAGSLRAESLNGVLFPGDVTRSVRCSTILLTYLIAGDRPLSSKTG